MKTIGLIGGMSWESSLEYYRMINEEVKTEMGGLHSAKCIMYSVDFEGIARYQREGDWKKAGDVLGEAAAALEEAGADFILLCTNTMHKVIGQLEERITIPILHIADAAAQSLRANGIRKAALLGTKYTMEQEFYKERLQLNGIEIIIPGEVYRNKINSIIFEELCLGKIDNSSRLYFKKIIEELETKGAQGIVLGCTEIGLLVKEGDSGVPLFDTANIHAKAAVRKAIEL
ncbi:aspartate/glutamate racemase family protein [Bacillus sp. AK031]